MPTPARFADLSYESQLETMLDMVHDVARLGTAQTEAKIERYLAKISPPSPAVERGIKRDPIVLSPAGKFQRLMDAAAAVLPEFLLQSAWHMATKASPWPSPSAASSLTARSSLSGRVAPALSYRLTVSLVWNMYVSLTAFACGMCVKSAHHDESTCSSIERAVCVWSVCWDNVCHSVSRSNHNERCEDNI